MRRMFWLRMGDRNLHLLKLVGSFLVFGSILKVAEAAYQIFLVVDKVNYVKGNPALIEQLFGWGLTAPGAFSLQDTIGVLLGPIANFMFWLGIAAFALIVYQSGRVIVPVEEFEQRISEHHRGLIQRAVHYAKSKKR